MKFGETVRAFRTEKGLTQEQLGDKLGVSGQAVSKWETTDCYPDAELLVPLSNALGVSLDVLFGNEKIDEWDAELRVAAVIGGTDEKDRFALCRRIGWTMEAAIFGEDLPVNKSGCVIDPTEEHGMSEIVGDTGFTQVSNRADAPYFAVFPEPEGGWAEAVGDAEGTGAVFEALAHKPTRQAVLFLLRQKKPYLFDPAILTEWAGVPAEEIGTVEENLKSLFLIYRRVSVQIGGETRTLWTYSANQKVLSLLIFARDVPYGASFRYQARGREEPLIR